MMTAGPPDERLVRLATICLALPEARQDVMGQHAAFVVRDKKFAYFLNDHHGDGIVSVCFKTRPGDNPRLMGSDATWFYSPAYIGKQGWVGLRLDLGEVDWPSVAAFVIDSYRIAAPKRLAALVEAPPA